MAYHPVPIKIAYTQTISAVVNAVGVSKHTPLFETAGTIFKNKPTPHSLPITPHHHSSAISSRSVLKLITNSTTPNCTLCSLIIPEPYPHLPFFLVALTDITSPSFLHFALFHQRWEHPIPQPPPEPPPRPCQPTSLRHTKRITDYFKSN